MQTYKKQKLSAPIIRYLITLNALDNEGGIRCVDIAENLSLSKPTVHAMMEALAKKGVVKKSKYGVVFLTGAGCELAARYSGYYNIVCRFLSRTLALPSEDSRNAALSLLAGLSDERIGSMCEIMRDTS